VSEQTFELTPELVKLLRASVVDDQFMGYEYGAAAINPKRPYGNSSVLRGVAEILGLPTNEDGDPLGEAWTRAHLLHQQTPLALQVVLSTGSFEPGLYERVTGSDRAWKLLVPTGGYVTLVEHNEHEGETWRYYMPVTGNADALNDLDDALRQRDDYGCEHEAKYVLHLNFSVPESTVDILVEHSDSGYMAYHNKLDGYLVLTPEVLHQIADEECDEDPLYKGRIRDLMRKEPV
jgi:hypothetical protein